MTCPLPLTSAYSGLVHVPSMMLSPGELSDQATLPVVLLTATKLGAFGSGTGLSSPPNSLALPVTANTRSPTTSGEPKDGKLVWKFDCNPKGSEFRTDSRGTRNYFMAPAIHDNRLYTAVGQQPDNGFGPGRVWCVDITRTGDVSEELEKGKANPNSGVVWHYGGAAPKGADRDYLFGRSISTPAIHDGLVYAAELDGFLHCLDAGTGKELWQEDLKGAVWGSPLCVDGKVYLPDDGGNVHVFAQGKEKKLLNKIDMEEGIKAAPVVANGVLYLLTDKHLFAIAGK